MKRAVILVAAAAGCVAVAGVLIGRTMHLGYGHAVYCALGMAATEGCDKVPATGEARLVSALVLVICIPLFAAAYGSLHIGALRKRLAEHHSAIEKAVGLQLQGTREHVSAEVEKATQAMHRRMDAHADLIRSMGATKPAAPAAPAEAAAAERLAPPAKGRRKAGDD